MKAANLSMRRVLDLAPSYIIVLVCGLTLNQPSEAALFDPERGAQASLDQPVANSGGSLNELRLDGIMTLGDQRRVLISGPDGNTYRFNWRGAIEQPLNFEGRSAERLAGFKLTAADTRSVWLQLPTGISCKPDPEQGITACEEGRVQLAMVRRSGPLLLSATTAEHARGNTMQQNIAPTLAGRLQQQNLPAAQSSSRSRAIELNVNPLQMQNRQPQVISSAPSSYFGYLGSGTTQASTSSTSTSTPAPAQVTIVPAVDSSGGSSGNGGSSGSGGKNGNTSDSSTNQQETVTAKTEADYPHLLNPERLQMQEEQQQLINSAPPGYWGVE